jgi:hypothetical protein
MLASQCNIYVHAGGYKCACLKQEQELRNTGKLRNLSLPVPRYSMQADKGPHVADRQADMAGAMCKSQRQGSPMSALGLGAPKGSSCLHVRVLKWNTHKSLIGSNLLYPQCNASVRYHFREGKGLPLHRGRMVCGKMPNRTRWHQPIFLSVCWIANLDCLQNVGRTSHLCRRRHTSCLFAAS